MRGELRNQNTNYDINHNDSYSHFGGGTSPTRLDSHRTFGFEARPGVATHGGAELFVSFDKRTKTPACANLIVDDGVAGVLWAALPSPGAKPAGTAAPERVARENP